MRVWVLGWEVGDQNVFINTIPFHGYEGCETMRRPVFVLATLGMLLIPIMGLVPHISCSAETFTLFDEQGNPKYIGNTNDMCWCGDGSRVVSVTDGMYTVFWDYPDGTNYQRYYTINDVIAEGSMDRVSVSHDGRYIMSMFNYREHNGDRVTKLEIYEPHFIEDSSNSELVIRKDAYHVGLAWSPFENVFITTRALDDVTSVLEKYEVRIGGDGKPVIMLLSELEFPGRVYGELSWSYDCNLIAVPVTELGTNNLLILNAGTAETFFYDSSTYTNEISALAWNPESNILAVGSSNDDGSGMFNIYDFGSGSMVLTSGIDLNVTFDSPLLDISWQGGNTLVTGERDGNIQTFVHDQAPWDTRLQWHSLDSIETGYSLISLSFHPENDLLAVSGAGNRVDFYNVRTELDPVNDNPNPLDTADHGDDDADEENGNLTGGDGMEDDDGSGERVSEDDSPGFSLFGVLGVITLIALFGVSRRRRD